MGLALAAVLVAAVPGCALLPDEFNLSPLYRHRRDEGGKLLELDVLWPIVHYEQTKSGGDDFRVRPLWRWISEAETDEHQFLWPFGRIRKDPTETLSRLFPLWFWSGRLNENDQRETDWYALLPFFWGGSREDGKEESFGFFPFYADLRDFLFYDRFRSVLFPLWVRTEKRGETTNQVLWPLIAWGGDGKPGGASWWRALPFYGESHRPGKSWYRSLLWPIFLWGVESMDTDDPVHTFAVFPFYSRQWSESGRIKGWSVLWPFFRGSTVEGRTSKLDLFWPIYRDYHVGLAREPYDQSWLWPFVAHTTTPDQDSWSILWPLVWWRTFFDPEGTQTHRWILPFFWRVSREYANGGTADFVKLWPLFHTEHDDARGDGDTQMFSPWPWREGNAYGIDEAYGWIWTLWKARTRAADDHAFATAAELFTTRTRKGRTTTSVPLLFNYEAKGDHATLRLFQLIPIPFGRSETAK